jgi:hypothetical protein
MFKRRRLSGGQVGAAFGVGIASYMASGHKLPVMDWRDYAAFVTLGLLLWWLSTPLRSDRLVDAEGHQRAGDSLAFVLGKTLNRIWRRNRI